MKACTKCKTLKSLDEFYKNPGCRDGHANSCKGCMLAQQAEYRAANLEAIRAKDRARHTVRREDLSVYQSAYYTANRASILSRQVDRLAALAVRTDEQIEADRNRLRPDGMKRCRRCREHLLFAMFNADATRVDGLCAVCRSCHASPLLKIARPYWAAHGIDETVCTYCGKSTAGPKNLHVDHLNPVSKGGTDEPWNLRPACQQCNLSKNAKPAEQWLDALDRDLDLLTIAAATA